MAFVKKPGGWFRAGAADSDPFYLGQDLDELENRISTAVATAGGGAAVNVQSYGATGDGSTDDYAAINSAIAAVTTLGGAVDFPPGTYMVSAKIVVPGGVVLRGTSMDYSTLDVAPARGSIIRASASISGGVVELGDDPTSTASGKTGASIQSMIVDGGGFATSAIKTIGRRNYIRWCQAWRGTTQTIDMNGQNGYLLDSVVGFKLNTAATGSGYSLRVANQDNKVYRNQIREGGAAQVLLDNAGEVEIAHNHIFGGYGGTAPRHNIAIRNGNEGWRITDNTIEASIGHTISLVVPASTTCQRLIVANNDFYQLTGFPAATYDVVALDLSAASTIMRAVVVMGNTYSAGGGGAMRSFVNKIGSGTLEQVAIVGNQTSGIDNAGMMRNFRADQATANSVRYFNGSTTAIYRTDNGGKSTQNGNGSATAFTIAHGLSATPDHVVVTPGHTDSKGDFYVTADATNITVTYGTAPANGTNNVVLNWVAQV